jgi:hypothetical protein
MNPIKLKIEGKGIDLSNFTKLKSLELVGDQTVNHTLPSLTTKLQILTVSHCTNFRLSLFDSIIEYLYKIQIISGHANLTGPYHSETKHLRIWVESPILDIHEETSKFEYISVKKCSTISTNEASLASNAGSLAITTDSRELTINIWDAVSIKTFNKIQWYGDTRRRITMITESVKDFGSFRLLELCGSDSNIVIYSRYTGLTKRQFTSSFFSYWRTTPCEDGIQFYLPSQSP